MLWEGMEANELGNKKLEPWEHWLVLYLSHIEIRAPSKVGCGNFVGNEDAIYGAFLEGPLPGLMAGG